MGKSQIMTSTLMAKSETEELSENNSSDYKDERGGSLKHSLKIRMWKALWV